MNGTEERYGSYSLVREMLETPQIVAGFDSSSLAELGKKIGDVGRLLMTGEGSSRLFPAKSAIAHVSRKGWPLSLSTEAGRQATEPSASARSVKA